MMYRRTDHHFEIVEPCKMKFAINDGDRRPTVREVAEKYGVSETTVHDILSQDLR